VTTEQRFLDHEKRITTMEGCLLGVLEGIEEIKYMLREGRGTACAEHKMCLEHHWTHIRALWGLIGAIGLLLGGALLARLL
jgi:hypothetical protein